MEGSSKKVAQGMGTSWWNSAPLRISAVVALLLLLLLGLYLLDRTGQSEESPRPQPVVRYGSGGPAKGTYEVVKTDTKNAVLRVTVVTKKSTDPELVAINDKLLAEYQSKAKTLYIDYFDDAAVAQVYFTQISDPKISTEQKKELASHYLALMVVNSYQGKKLFAVDSSGRVLKTY